MGFFVITISFLTTKMQQINVYRYENLRGKDRQVKMSKSLKTTLLSLSSPRIINDYTLNRIFTINKFINIFAIYVSCRKYKR